MMTIQVGQVLKEDDWFQDKPAPVFHFSKEVMRSFYLGWVVNKKSSWRNIINSHILKIQEVIFDNSRIKNATMVLTGWNSSASRKDIASEN